MQTFRDALVRIMPSWLQRTRAVRLLYVIGLHQDAFTDALVAGIEQRFPGVHSVESLPLLGKQRRIRRGPNESDAVYGSRLARWWDDHKRRGGPYALLEQVRAYWAPAAFKVELLYYSGRRFAMDVASAVVRDDIEWTPSGPTSKWARWWLFYTWPDPVEADGTWGDPGTWGDGFVWSSDLSVDEVANLRAVPREWNAEHCFGRVVLLTEGVRLWGYPVATWGEPGRVWGAPVQLGVG